MFFKLKNVFKDKKLIDECFNDFQSFENTSLYNGSIGYIKSKFASLKARTFSEAYVKYNFNSVWKAQILARKNGGLSGQYQWMRLKELAEIQSQIEFKRVLELGTGASTKMFSELVGKDGKVVSLEESEHWLQRTTESVGKLENTEFIHCERIVEVVDEEIVVRYRAPENIYKENYDLVYIDGPTTKLSQDEIARIKGEIPDTISNTVATIDSDLLMKNGIRPKLVVVDGKRPSIRWMFRRWEKDYHLFVRSIYLPYRDRTSTLLYHSIFVRKDLLRN